MTKQPDKATIAQINENLKNFSAPVDPQEEAGDREPRHPINPSLVGTVALQLPNIEDENH